MIRTTGYLLLAFLRARSSKSLSISMVHMRTRKSEQQAHYESLKGTERLLKYKKINHLYSPIMVAQ